MEIEKDILITNNPLSSINEVKVSIKCNSHCSPSKKKRGILNLLSINSLVCGVEIVSSCAFTYIPPLLLKSGYSEFYMTVILGLAPFFDMVTVPALAEWSDISTLKFGRRRPVIIGLSLILILSLLIIPFSQKISMLLVGESSGKLHMFVLATGVILLDYSYQAIFNPCEALLSDMMSTCERNVQTLGFSIYSACLSLGCIIGYLIVCIKWTALIPIEIAQEQMCFLIITLLLIPCLLLTLSNKEVPFEVIHSVQVNNLIEINGSKYHKNKNNFEPNLSKDSFPLRIKEPKWVKKLQKLCIRCCFRLVTSPLVEILEFLGSALYFGYHIFEKIMLLPLGCYKRIQTSPIVIQRVFFVELFGWTALHCHDRFFTDFVGQYMYAGDPNALVNTTEATLYDEGIQMGSWCLFLQSLAACLYAFFLQQHLVHLIGARVVFLGGIFVFLLSMVLTLVLPSIFYLKLATALSGIGTATLTTTPNMLVTQYFQKKEVYMCDSIDEGEEETNKGRGLGTEVAVLDMAYYLSQVTLSFFLGPLVEIFKSSLMYIIVSTFTSIIAFYCALRVVFTPYEFKLVMEGKF